MCACASRLWGPPPGGAYDPVATSPLSPPGARRHRHNTIIRDLNTAPFPAYTKHTVRGGHSPQHQLLLLLLQVSHTLCQLVPVVQLCHVVPAGQYSQHTTGCRVWRRLKAGLGGLNARGGQAATAWQTAAPHPPHTRLTCKQASPPQAPRAMNLRPSTSQHRPPFCLTCKQASPPRPLGPSALQTRQ